jgi:hypothetical protein
MKSALINASRNQMRFFSSIVAKCTSSGAKCAAPSLYCGPSWVICVELEINGISSSRTCQQGKVRGTPHKLRLVASMGPTRPGTVIPLSHVQKFSDPGRRESSLNLTRGSDVSHAHLDPRAFRAIQLQRTRSRRRARAKIHYTQVGHTKPGHAIPIMLVIKIIDNDGNVCLRGSCAVLQELSNSQYCLFV